MTRSWARAAGEFLSQRVRRAQAWVAGEGANVMPPIVEAVEARATVGEISDALRRVFGEHTEIRTL